MSDVLAYLDGVASRVSSLLLPSELKDVAQFLLGRQWLVAAGPTTAKARPDALARAPPTTARFLNGLLAWHGFIPLAIGATSMVSVLSTDGRAALSDFFVREGFAKVLAVNFIPNASVAAFSVVGGGADTAVAAAHQTTNVTPLAGASHVRNVQSARVQCMDAVRRFCAAVEAEAAAEAARAEPSAALDANPLRKHPRTDEATIEEAESGEAVQAVRVVRRLLIVVRCCADNRSATSTTAPPPSHSGSGRGGGGGGRPRTAGGTAGGDGSGTATARRHRHGADPLHLLLHDLAAVLGLSDVRLAQTGWRVRVGVLVLPDDQVYGGAQLARRLDEEVGQRYCVRLFCQSRHGDDGSDDARGGGEEGEEPFGVSRARRLLRVWEPAALYTTPAAATGTTTATEHPARAEEELSCSQLAATLLRSERYFHLRQSNLPLCCFLRDALRLFPVLVPPVVLRQWQVLWVARHSLQDVVLGFHSTLTPFTHASTFADVVTDQHRRCGTAAHSALSPTGAARRQGKSGAGSGEETAVAAVSVDDALEKAGRQRTSPSDILDDTTDVLDALLSAAASLSADDGDVLDEAVWFMLLYEELVQRRGSMRLSRIPALANALEGIYHKEWCHMQEKMEETEEENAKGPQQRATTALLARTTEREIVAQAPSLSATERLRRVVARHLPFYKPSRLVCVGDDDAPEGDPAAPSTALPPTPAARHRAITTLPAVLQFVNLKAPAGPLLQHTLLSALQPPSASLQELQAAMAAFQISARAALAPSSLTDSESTSPLSAPLLSANNFYSPLVPDSVRVLYLLTAHAVECRTDRQKHVPVVQLQQVCQLSDERLLLVLRELQLAGLATVNLREQTACTTLSA